MPSLSAASADEAARKRELHVQTTLARGVRNSGTVTPTINARMATTLAMTVIPPSVMTHRASLSRRLALRVEAVFNLGIGRMTPLVPKLRAVATESPPTMIGLFQQLKLLVDNLRGQRTIAVLDDDLLAPRGKART